MGPFDQSRYRRDDAIPCPGHPIPSVLAVQHDVTETEVVRLALHGLLQGPHQPLPRIGIVSRLHGKSDDAADGLLEAGFDQSLFAGEPPVDRADTDTGMQSDVIQRRIEPPLGKYLGCGLKDPLTVAAGVITAYLLGRQLTKETIAQATLHSYTTAFFWSAAIFVIGALTTGMLLRSGAARTVDGPLVAGH
jgi:uncharacterized membrane protein